MKKVHLIELVLGLVIIVLIASGWPKADPSAFGRRTHTFQPSGTVAPPLPVEDHEGVSPNISATPDGDWTDHLDRVNRRLEKQKKEGGR